MKRTKPYAGKKITLWDKLVGALLCILLTLMLLSMFNDARAAYIPTVNATDTWMLEVPKMTYIGKCYVTGYDTCVKCCGKTDGITASGVPVTVGKTIAIFGIPFGTKLYIIGLGMFTVEDRGVGRGVIDVACNNHSEAYAITGVRGVYIIE